MMSSIENIKAPITFLLIVFPKIIYRVGHKDFKMICQVYNYFYPEREERSADRFA
jgi:hypothetical protein